MYIAGQQRKLSPFSYGTRTPNSCMYVVSTVTRCQPFAPTLGITPSLEVRARLLAFAAQLTMLLATTAAPTSHEPASCSARPT